MSLLKLHHSFTYPGSRRLRSFIVVLSTLTGILILSATGLYAQGNLLITPRRVVFDGSKRSIDLNLANSGQDTATYAISLVQIRMKEDGNFETITQPDPGQRFADKYIRFFQDQSLWVLMNPR